jgi:hypothetical protein
VCWTLLPPTVQLLPLSDTLMSWQQSVGRILGDPSSGTVNRFTVERRRSSHKAGVGWPAQLVAYD